LNFFAFIFLCFVSLHKIEFIRLYIETA